MKNKLSGYGFYVFGGDLLRDTTLRRIGLNKYDWIAYTYRRGIVMRMGGTPVSASRTKGRLPLEKGIKMHVRRCIGTSQDFDNFVMEMTANTYDDVEPGMAKLYATTFPIIEE